MVSTILISGHIHNLLLLWTLYQIFMFRHILAWDKSKCMAAQPIRGKSCLLELSYHSEKLHFTMTSKGTFLANLVAGHAVVLKNKLTSVVFLCSMI
jgi:hypothetical protein